MRKIRNHPAPPSPNGVILLTVVFITLFLFTFAAVSLKSSYNDYNNAIAFNKRQHAYYTACNTAEKKIHELNLDYDNQPEELSFLVPVNADQSLEVSIHKDDTSYRVEKWILINTKEWSGDDKPLQLFVPEEK